MASGSQWLVSGGMRDEIGGFEGSEDALWAGLDAALFIRDELLSTTGQRIWGLTFTLYPDGKFNIDYDYKIPDGHEETNETIEQVGWMTLFSSTMALSNWWTDEAATYAFRPTLRNSYPCSSNNQFQR